MMMARGGSGSSGAQGIRAKILVPLFAVLVATAAGAILTIHRYHDEHTDQETTMRLIGLQQLFTALQDADLKFMHGQIAALMRDKELTKPFLALDRQGLYEQTRPLLQSLHDNFQITHFYFYLPDKTCFLRVYHPEKYGDRVHKQVLDQAVASNAPAQGLELGKYGTLSLRTVHPWRLDGQTAGYIELGIELGHLLPKLKEIWGIDILLVIDKSFLNRQTWVEGRVALGQGADWDLLPHQVLADSTRKEIPAALLDHLRHEFRGDPTHRIVLANGEEVLRPIRVPINDLSGSQVGELVALIDFAPVHHSLLARTRSFSFLAGGLGLLVVGFFVIYVGRIEQRLTQGHVALRDEIASRMTAEAELAAARDTLEVRVEERTHELAAANQQLLEERDERTRVMTSFRRLAQAVDQAEEMIFITDTDGAFQYVNPSFSRGTGYSPGEVVGHNARLLCCEDLNDAMFTELWRAISGGQPWSGRMVNKKRDGKTFDAKMTLSPVRDEGGEVQGVVAVCRDISSELAHEARLQQARQAEAIGCLTAGIAHELNTPAQYIGDNLRFLLEAFADLQRLREAYEDLFSRLERGGVAQGELEVVAKLKEDIDLAYLLEEIPVSLRQSLEGNTRISEIVRAMKLFAQPGSAERSATNINEALSCTIAVARNEWKYVAEVQTDFDSCLPMVSCRAGEMNQVWLHLIIATAQVLRDSLPEGGKGGGVIRVGTRQDGEQAVRVTIAGSVASDSSQEGTLSLSEGASSGFSRIYEPFLAVDGVAGASQSLQQSRLTVEEHGGVLHEELTRGRGVSFNIRLPLNPPAAQTMTG